MSEPMASLSDVHHAYGSITALRGVSLAAERGEVVALLGPNGVGKTTSVNLLLGLVPAQRGRVQVLGGAPGTRATRLRCGAMLQVSGLAPTLRVGEQIDLFRSYYDRPLSAERLRLSEGTVRNYLSEAIGKLGASNRIEAARLAHQKGWL